MKTKYKYIHFVETEELVTNKKVWECRNNRTKDILSDILYYKPWKEYCFAPREQGVIFNSGCLVDIADFIKQLNEVI